MYVQGMLKFTLTTIIETANKIAKEIQNCQGNSRTKTILHSLYELLGQSSDGLGTPDVRGGKCRQERLGVLDRRGYQMRDGGREEGTE